MDRFEKLAKDMAGMNRRDALRRVGGGLAGALLASFGVRSAVAGLTPPNSYCEKNCKTLYSPGGGNAYGQCVADCQACANSPGGTCFTGYSNCEGISNCFCGNTVEGSGFCFGNVYCSDVPTCSTSADCPTGFFCSSTTCCTELFGFGNVCLPPCATSILAPTLAASGPTAAGV